MRPATSLNSINIALYRHLIPLRTHTIHLIHAHTHTHTHEVHPEHASSWLCADDYKVMPIRRNENKVIITGEPSWIGDNSIFNASESRHNLVWALPGCLAGSPAAAVALNFSFSRIHVILRLISTESTRRFDKHKHGTAKTWGRVCLIDWYHSSKFKCKHLH